MKLRLCRAGVPPQTRSSRTKRSVARSPGTSSMTGPPFCCPMPHTQVQAALQLPLAVLPLLRARGNCVGVSAPSVSLPWSPAAAGLVGRPLAPCLVPKGGHRAGGCDRVRARARCSVVTLVQCSHLREDHARSLQSRVVCSHPRFEHRIARRRLPHAVVAHSHPPRQDAESSPGAATACGAAADCRGPIERCRAGGRRCSTCARPGAGFAACRPGGRAGRARGASRRTRCRTFCASRRCRCPSCRARGGGATGPRPCRCGARGTVSRRACCRWRDSLAAVCRRRCRASRASLAVVCSRWLAAQARGRDGGRRHACSAGGETPGREADAAVSAVQGAV